jgi:hypothetical protein
MQMPGIELPSTIWIHEIESPMAKLFPKWSITSRKPLYFKSDPSKDFDCYCDANSSGPAFAAMDPSTAKSRSGWVILYACCPIIWASKLWSEVLALSMTEAKHIAMLMVLGDIFPLMSLVQEMREQNF